MSSTILNDIVRDYESITAAWFNSLFLIAQGVFWTLVLIELIWSAIWWVVDREDGLGVVTALLRKVLAVGFFYAFLLNGGTWTRAVIRGFSQAGSAASGLPDPSPSGGFDQGLAPPHKNPKTDPPPGEGPGPGGGPKGHRPNSKPGHTS